MQMSYARHSLMKKCACVEISPFKSFLFYVVLNCCCTQLQGNVPELTILFLVIGRNEGTFGFTVINVESPWDCMEPKIVVAIQG